MLVWVVILGCVLVCDGVLFGGKAEGVPAHRVQDVITAHPLVAANDVGGRVALGMADVQAGSARVGKHVEDVELGPRGIEVDRAKGLVPFPFGLPLGLDTLRVVRRHWLWLSHPRPPRRHMDLVGPGVAPLTKKARRGFGGRLPCVIACSIPFRLTTCQRGIQGRWCRLIPILPKHPGREAIPADLLLFSIFPVRISARLAMNKRTARKPRTSPGHRIKAKGAVLSRQSSSSPPN